MDSIDITILRMLRVNCRTSYEEISKKIDVSANTVKRRVAKLISDNIIERFEVLPSLAMAEAEFAVCFILSKERRYDVPFIDKIASYSGILSVGFDNSGSYVIYAEYSGAKGLLELRSFLESLPDVNKVLIHSIPADRGEKTVFSDLQLRVLNVLRENPRRSIHSISKKTGISVKRVRRIVDEITDSKAINFGIKVNLQSSKNTVSVMNIIWNPKVTTPDEITDWLQSSFADSFYTISFSANASLAFAFHIFDSLIETIPIVHAISEHPGLKLDGMGVVFTIRNQDGLRGLKLNELLKDY